MRTRTPDRAPHLLVNIREFDALRRAPARLGRSAVGWPGRTGSLGLEAYVIE